MINVLVGAHDNWNDGLQISVQTNSRVSNRCGGASPCANGDSHSRICGVKLVMSFHNFQSVFEIVSF